jgi:SAM-dependent methyltransferase
VVLAVIYRCGMADTRQARSYGTVFNDVADAYDRHRPTYPDALIDRACAAAGLTPGARVLEIGCGTGQLTRSLLERGLAVTAVEPGEQLLTRARDQLTGAGELDFIHARFEEASVAEAGYDAVFSASAIHWVDPDVGWQKIADALAEDGTLALISYFGLDDPRSADDQQGLRDVLVRIAPELSAAWPTYRDVDDTVEGVGDRRANVSEAWGWLTSYDLGRAYVADLFDDAQLTAIPGLLEHTADELNALIGTMSFWARLSPHQRDAITAENRALHERLGRPIRSSTITCLLTARRTPRLSGATPV